MMPLAKRAGSAYLSFGLLLCGLAGDGVSASPRLAALEQWAPTAAAGRALGDVARGAMAPNRRPRGLGSGGDAGAGGTAAVPPLVRAQGASVMPMPGAR